MDYQSLSIEQLIRECAKNTDPAARAEFVRRFHRLIVSQVIKCCRVWSVRSQEDIKDLTNNVYVKLWRNNCSVLARFTPQHENAFLGYLKKMVKSVVSDHFRGEPDPTNQEEVDDATYPNQGTYGNPHVIEMTIFFDEIDALLRRRGNGSAEEKERMIFWLHFRQGLTCKAIAAIPSIKLTVKGVESVIFRLLRYLRGFLGGEPEDEN